MIRTTTSKPGTGKTATALRRRLLLWSTVPVFLALCVAVKLLSLGILAGRAADAFNAKDAGAVETAAQGLSLANVIEPHKAPFAAGDARVLAGDFAGARHLFEDALRSVPRGSADECAVRANLTLSIERTGDDKLRKEDPSSAAALFAEALAVANAAPEACFSGGAAAMAGEQLTGAEARLAEKLGAAAGAPTKGGDAAQESAAEEQPSPQQSQLDQLEENARKAERERNSGREREEYLRDDDYSTGPDRPW